jgi:hypothetical protein
MIREMAKLIIPENLKPQAKLQYIDKGGKNLRDEEEIINLCRDIKEAQDIEYGQCQKGSRGSSQTQPLTEEREKHDSAPCRKHDGAHQWKDCPENWHNKNCRTTSNDTPAASSSSSTQSKSSKGEVKCTESNTSPQNSTPVVRFNDIDSDDESANSSIASQGELMHIISKKSTKENLLQSPSSLC